MTVILLKVTDLAIKHDRVNISESLKRKERWSGEKPAGQSDILMQFILFTKLKYLLNVGTLLRS